MNSFGMTCTATTSGITSCFVICTISNSNGLEETTVLYTQCGTEVALLVLIVPGSQYIMSVLQYKYLYESTTRLAKKKLCLVDYRYQ